MSAVREAIEAVLDDRLDREPFEGWTIKFGFEEFLDALVEAVERVPVTVTIRDLDMAPENVLTMPHGEGLWVLGSLVSGALARYEPLHLAVDQGQVKFKVGNHSWSAPIRTEVYEG